MGNGIKLTKDLVIRCFAACREAERSLDRALHASWPEFLAYYLPNRLAAVRKLLDDLKGASGQSANGQIKALEMEVVPEQVPPGLFHLLWGRVTAGRKRFFMFREAPVRYLVAHLELLLCYLGEREGPEREKLIALRMAMYNCQRLIEEPCLGLPQLAMAARVEHFLPAKNIDCVKVEDLL